MGVIEPVGRNPIIIRALDKQRPSEASAAGIARFRLKLSSFELAVEGLGKHQLKGTNPGTVGGSERQSGLAQAEEMV